MSQWSHSHGRGKPRCYDSMCGVQPEVREQISNLTGNILLSLLLNGTFFLAIAISIYLKSSRLYATSYLIINLFLYILWFLNLVMVVKLTKKGKLEDKIIVAFVQIPTLLIHILLIYMFFSIK